MDLQQYLTQHQKVQDTLIEFLDEEVNTEEKYIILDQLFDEYHIRTDQHELTELLQLIVAISCNHSRSTDFFDKIERILLLFEKEIKQNFSNTEIFNFFRKNKRILLFLSKRNIITSIIDYINTFTNRIKRDDYLNYFKYENNKISNSKTEKNELNEYEKNRKQGENDDIVCRMIQKDSIDEFISFINQNNYPLKTQIEYSYFETNSFLIDRNPTLIEYSAFFGSIQIFKYLYLNNVELSSSLWIYAVHGRNPEIIHILEENEIKPKDISFRECIIESIKCHHNEIANYLINNYFIQEYLIDDDFYLPSIHYSNYNFFPIQLTEQLTFHMICKYNYPKLVNILIKSEDIQINNLTISKIILFDSYNFNLILV